VSVGFPIPAPTFRRRSGAPQHRRARPPADVAKRARVPDRYLSSADGERDALTVLKLLSFEEQIFVYVPDGELKTGRRF
jgi:hypothetical protein